MVLISSKKYACETCIKGHRSSTCKHTDRALFEIKKKGRPVTQCEHCRELRKTKQVHVKCICELKETGTGIMSPGASKKGNSQVPESATFPYGLPEALEASVALQLLSEGSSDSDHGGPCACKSGGECHCCTPRISVPKTRRKISRQLGSNDIDIDRSAVVDRIDYNNTKRPINSALTPSHIRARISEFRPVLPKPPINKDGVLTGPLRIPSSGLAHGQARHHHDNTFFSPYERAYGYAHGSHEQLQSDSEFTQQVIRPTALSEASLHNDQSYSDQFLQIASSWMPTNASTSFRSLCGCGDGCSCPGCMQHNPSAVRFSNISSPPFQSCTNPGACAACVDCTILSVPDFLSPDAALSMYNSNQSQAIDEWLGQVPALPTSSPVPSASTLDQTASETSGYHPPPPWNTFQMPRIPESDRLPVVRSGCCDGQCRCPPGLCRCEYRDVRDNANPQGTTTLVTSSGHTHCSGKMDSQEVRRPSLAAGTNREPISADERSSMHFGNGGFLMIPNMARSRSSSVSSQSSAGPMSNGRRPFRNNHSPPASKISRMSPTSLSFPSGSPTSSRVCHAVIVVEPGGDGYAGSNPDSDLPLDDGYSQYDPSLDGIQLY